MIGGCFLIHFLYVTTNHLFPLLGMEVLSDEMVNSATVAKGFAVSVWCSAIIALYVALLASRTT